MAGVLLALPEPGLRAGRSFVIEPSPCGGAWVLTLFDGFEPMGGGRYECGKDEHGFDAGYQDALDQGEAWL